MKGCPASVIKSNIFTLNHTKGKKKKKGGFISLIPGNAVPYTYKDFFESGSNLLSCKILEYLYIGINKGKTANQFSAGNSLISEILSCTS